MINQIYSIFVKSACNQDRRNKFDRSVFPVKMQMPSAYLEFISHFNPVDVEVNLLGGASILFFPAEKLREVQKEFSLPDGYLVFAAYNGSDPIAFSGKKVYTSIHGQGSWEMKRIYNTFVEFLADITSKII